MSKIDWDDTLYKFARGRFCKSDESVDDETVNESADDEPIKEPIVDIEFLNKRELYNYYWIDAKTIPVWHEVKMQYVKTNGKMGRLYKLVKKWINNVFTFYFSCKEMTTLTELFTMNDMDKLKNELARLVESKDYKTVNTLLTVEV